MTCKNCGNPLDNNSKFCIACGTPVSPAKKKKKKAPIFIALFLVLALVAGGGIYLAFANAPATKVYGALKNTVFESSEYEIDFKYTYDSDDDEFISANIKLTLGEDIDSSVLDMKVTEQWTGSVYDEYGYATDAGTQKDVQTITIKNGKIYVDGEHSEDLDNIFSSLEDELEYYTDENIDIEEEINNLINGKIDEKALEKLYNEKITSIVEEIIKESSGETVELPEYKDILGNSGTLSDLFKNKDVQEALALEKIKSDLPGTTYEYSLDIGDLAEAVLNYAMEDEQYMEYLETIVDNSDYYDDVEELVEDIVDELKEEDNIEGTLTVKSNRITNFTVEIYDSTIEISIKSK